MNPEIRAVGFDLGETLLYYRDTPLNWTPLYFPALNRMAVACGLEPTPDQFAVAAQVLGEYNTRLAPRTFEVTADEILSRVLCAWNAELEELPLAIEAFFGFFRQRIRPDPAAIQILELIRRKRLPVGILTDVPYGMPRVFVERDLADADLAGRYDQLLTSVDVGVRKPEALGYEILAARLGVAPQEMLFVGNEPKDVTGARRAGASAVLLSRADYVDHGQRFTIASLLEINDILRGRHVANGVPIERTGAIPVEPH